MIGPGFIRVIRGFAFLYFIFSCIPEVNAHPVPRKSHDRTVTVRVTATAIVVDYHLEVDEWTVVYVDVPAAVEKAELAKLRKPDDFYTTFIRCYGPILAKNVVAQLDVKELSFRCIDSQYHVADHVICDFRFEAACELTPGKQYSLTVREDNYEQETGMLRLSITNSPDTPFLKRMEPDEILKNRPASELKPGDDDKLRKASATFEWEKPVDRPCPEHMAAPFGKAHQANHLFSRSAFLTSSLIIRSRTSSPGEPW